jgi:hypothetical protein
MIPAFIRRSVYPMALGMQRGLLMTLTDYDMISRRSVQMKKEGTMRS